MRQTVAYSSARVSMVYQSGSAVPVVASDAQGPVDLAKTCPIDLVPRDDVTYDASIFGGELGPYDAKEC